MLAFDAVRLVIVPLCSVPNSIAARISNGSPSIAAPIRISRGLLFLPQLTACGVARLEPHSGQFCRRIGNDPRRSYLHFVLASPDRALRMPRQQPRAEHRRNRQRHHDDREEEHAHCLRCNLPCTHSQRDCRRVQRSDRNGIRRTT